MRHKQKISPFTRVIQIITALIKNLHYLRRSRPLYFRMVIEDLGGGIIKLAQILAMRYDLLPSSYCKELANLFDRVAPISEAEVRAVFQEDLGVHPENLFQEFSYTPIASASFGQVHKAAYQNYKVAIKVQKPRMRAYAKADIKLIKFLANFLSFFIKSPVNLKDAIKEWETWTKHELDYKIEAENALRFRKSNTNPHIYIPWVVKELSTSRIIVTEFIEGETLNDMQRNPSAEKGIIETATRQLIWTSMWSYFKDGYFHADPHPGNLILMPDGRLGMVDFGIMGEVESEGQKYHFSNFVKYAAQEDADNAVKHIKEVFLGTKFENVDFINTNFRWHNKSPEQIQRGIVRYLEKKLGDIILDWAKNVSIVDQEIGVRSTARHFLLLVQLARRFGLEIPASLLSFIRGLVIVDMVCLSLNPKFNIKEEIALFLEAHPEATMPKAVAVEKVEKEKEYAIQLEKKEEEKQRSIEYYIEYAEQMIERILEEGSRGLAYFSTNFAYK